MLGRAPYTVYLQVWTKASAQSGAVSVVELMELGSYHGSGTCVATILKASQGSV